MNKQIQGILCCFQKFLMHHLSIHCGTRGMLMPTEIGATKQRIKQE